MKTSTWPILYDWSTGITGNTRGEYGSCHKRQDEENAAGLGTQEAGHVLEADAEGREFHKLVSCMISFIRES